MYQGHSQAHHGLQNHSVGGNYPYIVVGLGSGLYQVELYGKVLAKDIPTAEQAYETANRLKEGEL